MRELSFPSHGVRCSAWHLTASSEAFAGPRGRACVVMAHGFGGTRDTALLPYAEGFAAAGLDVLVFDYRGFGASDGTPRQRVAFRDQREDYRAAIEAARHIEGVDPERIVLWGTSYSGGHVVPVAAADGRIAAVMSLTPAMDGLAALRAMARHGGVKRLGPLVWNGVRDAVRAVVGRAPHHLPVVGPPGTVAIITAPGAVEGYLALAGPTWRNEVCARTALEVAFNRPARFAAHLDCPMLVQIGERDAVAPPAAALSAATAAGAKAEVCTYPVGHFDVYDGPWQQQAVADQVEFASRHLGALPSADSANMARG
jgi:pimeloyl-ACP methyl ester carboxylesterase